MSIESIDTFTIPTSPVPEKKARDIARYAQRHSRRQDHGDAAERKGHTVREPQKVDIINIIHPPEYRARLLAKSDRLAAQPDQLEAEADRLLFEADFEEEMLQEEAEYNDYTRSLQSELEDEDDAHARAVEAYHRSAENDVLNREVGYGSLGIAPNKRRSKDVTRQYEGSTGDNEDTELDVTRGFTFTTRP